MDVSDQSLKLIPGLLRELRPKAGLLDELEEHSEAYVLTPRRKSVLETSDALQQLLGASDPAEFDAELERLAREGAAEVLHALVSEAPRQTSTSVGWPMVFNALRRVLSGDSAADRFLEGLTLLSLRIRFAARVQAITTEVATKPEVPAPELVDPEIGEHLFAAKKADVCMLAVFSLLAERNTAQTWLGRVLAEQFYSGQAAGVRAVASLFDDEQADKALELAGQSRFDWGERIKRMMSIERSLEPLADKAKESGGVWSPFGEGYDDEPYEFGDEDDWTPAE